MNDPLLILDIRGLLIRAYNTPSDPTTATDSTGNEVLAWEGGLRAFLQRDLLPLFDTFAPRQMIAVWDDGNKYRLAAFSGYKKKRRAEEKDPALKDQLKHLFNAARSLLAHLGVKHVKVEGEEADDVIALLCQKLRGASKVVWTVDSDLLQLVDEETTVLLANKTYRFGSTYKDFPVSINCVLRSILGDSTDEYPGVYGVGEKKVASLFAAYGEDGLQELEQAIASNNRTPVQVAYDATQDEILGTLLGRWDEWRSSYNLAKLHPEICYAGRGKGKVIRPKWALRLPNKEKVQQVLDSVEKGFLMQSLERFFPTEKLITADNYTELEPMLNEAAKTGRVSYDFESYDTLKNPAYQEAAKGKGNYVDVLNQSITGISFNYGRNFENTVYVSFDHAETANLTKAWALYVLDYLNQIPIRVVQNASFERTVAKRNFGHEVKAPFDTQIMASYVDENLDSNLKGLTKELFNYDQTTYAEVTGGKPMNELTAEHVTHYGCDDSLVCSFLFDFFHIVMQLEDTWDFYAANEVEHMHDESDTFIYGTRIDTELLAKMAAEEAREKEEAVTEVRRALEQHAMNKPQDQRTQDALALVDIDWELKQYDFEDPESEEASKAKIELWNKAWYRCVYTPYVEQEELPGFKPTAKGLNQVLAALGIDAQVQKVSARAMSAWIEEHQEILHKHEEFLSLLGPAVSHFPANKREGAEYERFERFCVQVLANAGGMVHTSTGDELNFGSPPQMQAMLYGMMGLPVRRRSKPTEKRRSLGLQGAAATGLKPIASALVYDVTDSNDWRYDVLNNYKVISRAMQNESLYYKPYPLWVSPIDGLIHPQIKNCGTVTRRPSGTSPNVLQVSKKGEAKIRKAYTVYNEDYAYVCIDFDGQELRLTASESRDPVMVDSYIGEVRKDIHSLTGASLAPILLPRMDDQFKHLQGQPFSYEDFMAGRKDKDKSSVFKDIRNQAKVVNFLIIYVGSAYSLAEGLIIPINLAESMMNAVFSLYRRLRPWQQEVIEEARTHGFVTTAYGTRRHLTSDLYSQDDGLRARQERQAVNMKAQGCAADILKVVKTEYRKRGIMERYKVRSSKPIYDEIAACVPIASVPEYIAEMREIMELTPPGHPIPMEISCKIGLESWGGAVELDDVEPATITQFLEQQKEQAA